MTIPDDLLADYLDTLVGRSAPGAVLHHLLVSAAGPGDRTALGTPEPAKLAVTMYAIDPGDKHPLRMVDNVVRMAVVEAYTKGQEIHFAGLALEAHSVPLDRDGVPDELARRLQSEGRLQDHPDAVETTRLYAACRDGRRWTGSRYLTGPQAGTTVGPTELVGPLDDNERNRQARLIRHLVGIPT